MARAEPAAVRHSRSDRLLTNLGEDETFDSAVDEEARLLTEPVDLIPHARNPPIVFGMDEFPQRACNDQPDLPCRLTSTLLIEQKDVGSQMERQGDGLGFSWIERNR